MAQTCSSDCLRIIFSHFAPFLRYPDDNGSWEMVHGDWSEPKAHLAACALVCRAWNGPATELLYKHVAPAAIDGNAFLTTIANRPH